MNVTRQGVRSDFEQQLVDELQAMATYALGSGVRMSESVVRTVMEVERNGPDPLDTDTLVALANAHEALSRQLAPATPQALNLLDDEAHRKRRVPWLPSLGPVPLVRQMTLVSLIFLLAFIALGLSSSVSRTSGGILDSSGTTLLLNLLFVLCASGLGAVFAALFRINKFIANRTYDPIFESSYWVNIVLGLIGGLLLAELLLEILDNSTAGEQSGVPFARPLLALVGGFSAKVVFQILNKLVDAVGSVFQGSANEVVAANTEAARAKLAAQQTEERMNLSTRLVQLQQSLNTGATPEQLGASVGAMLDDLLPFRPASTALAAANGSTSPDPVEHPSATGPTTSDPAVIDPAATDPAGTDTTATGPAGTDTTATDPAATDTTSTDTTATDTSSDPATSDPAADPTARPG